MHQPGERFHSLAARFSVWGAVAIALALPLIGLAVWANHQGFISPSLQWVEHRGNLVTSGSGFTNIQYLYPPMPVLLAIILPGGYFSLAIVTCLFSGLMLAILMRRIGRPDDIVVLALPMVAVPAMWYVAAEALPTVIAMTFLAIALHGFIQFATYGETYGGFVAGISLAVCYAADPGALLYAGVMCLFVPLIAAERYHGDPQAPIGVCAVLVFPCVAMAACWSFLIWKFSGVWPGNFGYAPNAAVLKFPYGVVDGLGRSMVSALEDLARAPLYIVAVLLMSIRRRAVNISAGLILPVLALGGALWLGFDYSSVASYFMFTLLAVTVIVEHQLIDSRLMWLVLLAAAVVQVIVGILYPPSAPGYTAWWHTLT